MGDVNRELKIAENAAEIMLVYNDLSNRGKVLPIYDDEIDSHELLSKIAEIAAEFEEKYHQPEDYFTDLDEFATRKLIEEYGVNYMEDAGTNWFTEDISGGLKSAGIPATGENIRQVCTREFVRGFHDRLSEFGNEMIAHQIDEVF